MEKTDRIFKVHGELHSASVVRLKLKYNYGWDSAIPELKSVEEIPI